MSVSTVRVTGDPATAFRVFTEEIDLWWVRGPANFRDAARARGMRIEPGRRLVQINEGAEIELGRITRWEPPAELAYETADGGRVTITFTADAGATVVSVEQHGPGMGSWPTILEWFRRRADDGHRAAEMPRVSPVMHYADVPAAARWLADAFGFWCRGVADEYAELELGGGVVLLRRGEGGGGAYVYVDDLPSHLAQAERHGATIAEPIHRRGDTVYVAVDLAGHRWTFAQARPAMLG
jgi:hypothetical protein